MDPPVAGDLPQAGDVDPHPDHQVYPYRLRGVTTTLEEVLRQMEVRHRKRQAAIDSAYRKQQLNE